jgi:hypothetical protein
MIFSAQQLQIKTRLESSPLIFDWAISFHILLQQRHHIFKIIYDIRGGQLNLHGSSVGTPATRVGDNRNARASP